jgi:amino acid transporter
MVGEKPSPDAATPGLRRALGKWDLTAIGVNQVIGGAIFLMPSQVAAQVGNWSLIAFLLAGLASLWVALCFAEVGSRFDRTGGPYLYARAAFGRLVSFEVGWMLWFTRAASQASIANGVALALGYYWEGARSGAGRALVITFLVAVLAVVNVRGIRQSAWLVNSLTIGKLLPLSIFIAAGLFFVDWGRLASLPQVSLTQSATAALLLIFVFGGYDVVPVPAGEAKSPRRHVPFALVSTILIVTAVMTLAQLVAMGTLPGLPSSSTPLADASALFLGGAGALMIGLGSIVSMSGNLAGQVLSGSRMLFALAENGELPRFLSKIHPGYRTPSNAVLFTSAVALGLALSGSFVLLAAASAVARLVAYTGACAATLALRTPRHAGKVRPAEFVIPLGPIVPVLAILTSVAILLGATGQQLFWGGVALVAGAILFLVNDRLLRRASAPEVTANIS